MKALLLSGGMDSVCIAFWKRPEYAITLDYGQKSAQGEILAASEICKFLRIEHVVEHVDISNFGSGDLAGTRPNPIAPASEWWPYRNQFLTTLAAMKCQQLMCRELLIGALKTDGFHVDGTPAFIDAMNSLFELQEGQMELSAPAIHLTAAELVIQSGIPLDLLCWSHSCHISNIACGFCRGCRKHFETMEQVLGVAY